MGTSQNILLLRMYFESIHFCEKEFEKYIFISASDVGGTPHKNEQNTPPQTTKDEQETMSKKSSPVIPTLFSVGGGYVLKLQILFSLENG